MATCSKVAVWARLPSLPIEFYELEVLQEIGRAIGLVLRIDAILQRVLEVDMLGCVCRLIWIRHFQEAFLLEELSKTSFMRALVLFAFHVAEWDTENFNVRTV